MPASYDQTAKHYDRLLGPLERHYLSGLRAEMFALIPADSILLEIGAGTGANFRFYPESDLAVASEPSAGMLEFARSKARNIELVQADVLALPFPADHFDVVFAALVFCSVADPGAGFAEIRRVIKPGGRLFLLEHVRPSGLLGFIFDNLSLVTVPLFDDHFNRRTAQTVESSGFRIIEVRKKAFGAVNLIVCEPDDR